MKNRIVKSVSMVLFVALLLSYLKVEVAMAEEKYSRMGLFQGGRCRVKKGDKYGFIDKEGKEVIPCVYDEVSDFSEGLCGVRKDGKIFFIDKEGKKVLKSEYKSYFFWNGFARIIEEDEETDRLLHGYMNKEGKVVIKPKYMKIDHIGDKFYVENKKNLNGVLDEKGRVLIPEKYNGIQEEREGLMSVYKTDKGRNYGFVDEKGREVIKLKYAYTGNFSGGVAPVKEKGGKWLIIDKKGRQIGKKLDYESVKDFLNGFAFVMNKKGKWGMIDKKGKEVMSCKYAEISFFSEGMMSVRVGNENEGKWGFINQKGKEVIKEQYDNYAGMEYYHFSEGLAAVIKNRKSGFIDKKGKTVIPFQYDLANNFINGYAKVTLKQKEGIIDRRGKEVIPCKYEEIEYLEGEDLFQAREKNFVFLLDKKGKVQKKFVLEDSF